MTLKNKIGLEIMSKFGTETPKLPESSYSIIGVPKKTFRKYVKNDLQPRLDELQRISKWLGVEPKELF